MTRLKKIRRRIKMLTRTTKMPAKTMRRMTRRRTQARRMKSKRTIRPMRQTKRMIRTRTQRRTIKVVRRPTLINSQRMTPQKIRRVKTPRKRMQSLRSYTI